MKKVSLLLAMIAFVCGNAFAQLSFDFNDCPAGAKIAQTLGDPWSTWSNAPGSAEDGVFGEIGGSMAAHFTYGNDQIIQLGDHSTGVYDLEFDAYVPEGKNGYFNVLHHFAGSNSTWAMQVYMHETNDGQNSTSAPGHGTVHAGSNATCDLPCVYDQWMHFRVHVDADNDVAQLWFNVVGQPEQMYCEWQWSLDSFGENVTDRVLGAMDFFPPENAATSEYYIDNLVVTLQVNEEVLIAEPFEEYTVGNKIGTESAAAGHDWWTTWSNAPGSAEDGVVASFDGTKCGHLTYGNDQVLLLGDEQNGVYDLEFDILVPEGKNGYFNILHHFAGSNSTWAMQCYLHLTNDGQNSTSTPGQGTIHAGSNSTATVNCVYDDWMHFRLHVDTDTDVAQYYYTAPGAEEILVCEWQWSLDSFGENVTDRTLAAMNFFPPLNAATSEYYLDNFSFKKIGGESAPEMVITPNAFDTELAPNDMTMFDVVIANDGNSMGDWSGWVDFGQGEDGTAGSDLMYHNGEPYTGIGHSEEHTREIAIRLTPQMYAGVAMGKKLVSVQYLTTADAISADGHYTFRLYGQGVNDQPGELLAEKTINSTAMGTWVSVNFDEAIYLTGQEIWASVELLQAAGQYPLNMDNGHLGQVQDGNWLATDGGAFSHCYSEGSFDGAWMITAHCEGNTVPGGWASLSKTNGNILGGQSETVTLALNSIGLADGDYNANLIINTNDAENPHVEIPIHLKVDSWTVAETNNSMATVYPNPASAKVTLEGENLNAVAIYNVAGQLVRIVKLDGAVNTIDMNVEAGVYFFSIYDNAGNNVVERVVITK
ncbi:MAG: T9SS type A sorting domain-containing protein [Bacteroidales bacterium]|nr:T9SS type A sorting domain-containing protein [Bacteroidales bacterium]